MHLINLPLLNLSQFSSYWELLKRTHQWPSGLKYGMVEEHESENVDYDSILGRCSLSTLFENWLTNVFFRNKLIAAVRLASGSFRVFVQVIHQYESVAPVSPPGRNLFPHIGTKVTNMLD
ncbi:hypothetical protein AVEN_173622-1 [Araneus ventricosus]|uniref:Uncharacterized protein n=1 Tax=Araneus ventricosus TaxID=182803 RepID=A0A4Y2AYA8_ARAVE|nr:hypothetical protein AVEN_173622-1 [Araneus ventricosus]